MKVAIASFVTESVTFVEEALTLSEFKRAERRGQDLIDANRGANTATGGAIDALLQEKVELHCILRTMCEAAGPCSDEALDYYKSEIVRGLQAVRHEIDGVFLELHGAIATKRGRNADKEIIGAVRAVIGPHVPLTVALDYHANLDESVLDGATGVFGFHYSPHTDMAATGRRAADCLLRCMRGEIKPRTVLERAWVMVPSISTATALSPLRSIVEDSISMARFGSPYRDVSVFAGFAYADVPSSGFSVVVVSDASQRDARSVARKLADRIWDRRREIYASQPIYGLAEGVKRAISLAARASKPIVLLEHADRMKDSTHVTNELVRQGASGIAVPFIWDPKAAGEIVRAGKGARVRVRVGGRTSSRAGAPIEIDGVVRHAGELEYTSSGQVFKNLRISLGPCALIETGTLTISVISNNVTAIDEDCFTVFGLEPSDFRFIVLRSKTHFRAAFSKLAEEIIIVDTPDWGPADLLMLPYENVARDRMFPFCENFRWSDAAHSPAG